jgi:putative copper resistance protein D
MGYVAVATLIGTGLVNSWFLVGSPSNLLTTTYGQLLLAKLAMFAGMLVLAASNRFWLLPSLQDKSGDKPAALDRLFYHVLGEQLLGAMVLFIVSILGTLRPAIAQ